MADYAFARLMRSGTFGDYLDAVAAERRDDFDSPVSLEDVVELQLSIEGRSRPFSNLATFVPPNWERRKLLDATRIAHPGGIKYNLLCLAGTCIYVEHDGVEATLRLVSAGGAVQHWLYEQPEDDFTFAWTPKQSEINGKPFDVDYFIVAETEADYVTMQHAPHDFMTKAAQVAVNIAHRTAIERASTDTTCSGFSVSKGVATTVLLDHAECTVSLRSQIILRGPYRKAGAVISGFDLPVSAVYATRKCIAGSFEHKFTTGGAYTAATGLQIIDTANRSTTFALRVAKYMTRGVGIVLPEISPDKVHAALKEHPEGFALDTLDYRLHILAAEDQKRTEPNMWRCQIELLDGPNQEVSGGSDYLEQEANNDARWEYKSLMGAIKYLGGKDTTKKFTPRIRINTGSNYHWVPEEVLPIPATVGDYLRLLESGIGGGLLEHIKHEIPTCRSGEFIGEIASSKILKTVLGMSPETLEAIQNKVQDAWDHRDRCITGINFGRLISPYVEEAIARMYARSSEPVEFWVRFDPQRQWWTASLNPAVVDPSTYYKQFYREVDRALRANNELLVNSSQLCDMPTREVRADYCPLCLEPVYPGDKNSITLTCGHTMCHNLSPDCGGWQSVEGHLCPVCRYDSRKTKKQQTLPVRIVRPNILVL